MKGDNSLSNLNESDGEPKEKKPKFTFPAARNGMEKRYGVKRSNQTNSLPSLQKIKEVKPEEKKETDKDQSVFDKYYSNYYGINNAKGQFG